MAIPNPTFARYPSFQEFLAKTKGKDNAPSFTNLFSVRFVSPPMMQYSVPTGFVGPVQENPPSGRFDVNQTSNDLSWLLDYYADTVIFQVSRLLLHKLLMLDHHLSMQQIQHIVRLV